MIFITQLVYIIGGQESLFEEFESVALPAISRYNGRLLLRLRPDAGCFLDTSIGRPYEVHLVEFETENDFESFSRDEERKKFLHLKEASVQSTLLIKGEKL